MHCIKIKYLTCYRYEKLTVDLDPKMYYIIIRFRITRFVFMQTKKIDFWQMSIFIDLARKMTKNKMKQSIHILSSYVFVNDK